MFAVAARLAALLAALAQTAPAATATCSPADSVRVPILVYHDIAPAEHGRQVANREFNVTPAAFEAQMRYLHDQGFRVISLGALVEALEKRCAVPARTVVITFDDGRENQYRHAFPVLKRYGFTATFFPFTHAMNRNPRYLTWEQLREMQRAGMTIGSHAHLHPRMDKITDPAIMKRETAGSREILQQRLESGAEFFAYPFGAMSAQAEEALRAAGFRAARSFSGGGWNSARDLFRLRAVPVTENMKRFQRILEQSPAPAISAPAPAPAGKGGRDAERGKGQ